MAGNARLELEGSVFVAQGGMGKRCEERVQLARVVANGDSLRRTGGSRVEEPGTVGYTALTNIGDTLA